MLIQIIIKAAVRTFVAKTDPAVGFKIFNGNPDTDAFVVSEYVRMCLGISPRPFRCANVRRLQLRLSGNGQPPECC